MKWSLYNKKEYLKPYVFSNGKSQSDIVNEVMEAIKKGYKIIFIHGFCGTGKSAIALNIAKEIGRTSIVVPVKNLQNQYFEDYTNNLHINKNNNEKLKISVMFGRQNFRCTFSDEMADNLSLPCTIDVNYRENEQKLFEYAEKNPFINVKNLDSYKQVKRMSVAPACPSWSPVLPADFEVKILKDAKPATYEAVNGKYVYYKRGGNCPYYNQYQSYIDADVIIFNSMKYEIENAIGRKPKTEIEIIDECDEFLDNLGNEKIINLNLLSNRINFFMSKYKDIDIIPEISDLVLSMIKNSDKLIENQEILILKESKIKNLMSYFLNHTISTLILNDEEDYLFNVHSYFESFKNYIDETYVVFSRNKRNEVVVKLIMVNLERKLKEFLDKNNVFVMMSGTLHSKSVLENIFGIKNYKIIEAEVKEIGKRNKIKTGNEKEFNYQYLKKDDSREEYLKAFSECMNKAKKPVLVHVNAFKDLPSEFECSKYGIYNIKAREILIKEQSEDKTGLIIQKFKDKKIDILYSTKCNRGVDFPGDICRSIVFTKFPYPDKSSLFWRILSKINKRGADLFYFDKSRREIIQRSFRGVRSRDDYVDILSPDIRVLDFFR